MPVDETVRFHEPVQSVTVSEVAALVGGTVLRGPTTVIANICALDEPREGAIAFLADRTKGEVSDRLAAVLVTERSAERVPDGVAAIVVGSPNVAFATVGRHLYEKALPQRGIHPLAAVDATAIVEEGASIGPGAVVEAEARIGRGTVVGAGAVVGERCHVGRACRIGANVTLDSCLIGDRVEIQSGSILGEPGFGYVPGPKGIDRVMQIGRVIVQDDVHMGANVCIDRGAIGDTVIGEGTKIGNLQQIAHNTRIGRHCIVAGNGGIAGSVTIGDGVTMAGGVFTSDHLTIGDGATIAGTTFVRSDVPPGVTWGGIPARPIGSYLRDMAEITARAHGRGRRAGKEKAE